MALDDIVFSEGDIQNFIVELDAGTLNPPDDIVFGNAAVDLMELRIDKTPQPISRRIGKL